MNVVFAVADGSWSPSGTGHRRGQPRQVRADVQVQEVYLRRADMIMGTGLRAAVDGVEAAYGVAGAPRRHAGGARREVARSRRTARASPPPSRPSWVSSGHGRLHQPRRRQSTGCPSARSAGSASLGPRGPGVSQRSHGGRGICSWVPRAEGDGASTRVSTTFPSSADGGAFAEASLSGGQQQMLTGRARSWGIRVFLSSRALGGWPPVIVQASASRSPP